MLLGNRHDALNEGLRGLLETLFDAVFIAGDGASLLEGAERLRPDVEGGLVGDAHFDDGDGLLADQTYAKKLDSIRSKGRTVCEFTRFAVSSAADSKSTISGLFDLSYVIGRKMLGVTDVVVEVNPRHVGFYKRAFGFEPISDVRTCERVNAPAVLLRLDVSRLEGRMREAGALTPGQLTLARG